MARWLRRLALLLLLGVLTLAALTAHTVIEGERAMQKSEAAFDSGAIRDSILHARRAAILYVPGARHERAAYERLTAIAVGAESRGDTHVAVEAWSAIRAAAIESRHVLTPRSEELARANKNLARLSSPAPAPEDREALREEAALRLTADGAIGASWVGLLGFGLALCAAGIGIFVTRGVTADGRFSWRGVRWAAVLAAIGVACWTIAVIRA